MTKNTLIYMSLVEVYSEDRDQLKSMLFYPKET
jgi:hypothetical protein